MRWRCDMKANDHAHSHIYRRHNHYSITVNIIIVVVVVVVVICSYGLYRRPCCVHDDVMYHVTFSQRQQAQQQRLSVSAILTTPDMTLYPVHSRSQLALFTAQCTARSCDRMSSVRLSVTLVIIRAISLTPSLFAAKMR